jgi:hypothetical protein
VIVHHDIARGIDDESRAKALKCLPNFAGTTPIVAEVLRGKVFKRIADPASYDPVLMSATAGSTLATASTAGSEAGSPGQKWYARYDDNQMLSAQPPYEGGGFLPGVILRGK